MGKVGCALMFSLLCIWVGCLDAPKLPGGGVLQTCEKDSDCASLASSYCDKGLCSVWKRAEAAKESALGDTNESTLQEKTIEETTALEESQEDVEPSLEAGPETNEELGPEPELEPENPCGVGQLFCGGACVEAQTDLKHCGQCENACAGVQSCVQGLCKCPNDGQLCDSVCVDLQKNTAHCGDCDIKCAANELCEDGECRAPCKLGESRCGSACVDLQKTKQHCGGCGIVCRSDQVCLNGFCACPGTEKSCGMVCVNTKQDPKHCGDCGKECASGTVCLEGNCVANCVKPTLLCGTSCVDVSKDPKHCGACNQACPSGADCVGTVCKCPTGLSLCGKACVDMNLDPSNCGACGQACGAGATCVNGTCACAKTTLTYCANQCVYLMGDAKNCGACGVDCGAGKLCWAGVCQPSPYVTTFVGAAPGSPSSFLAFPCGLVRNAQGTLLVGDFLKYQIFSVDTQRRVSVWAGSLYGMQDNAIAIQAKFTHPCGLTYGPTGDLYVADIHNHRIRQVSPQGVVSTVAGGALAFKDATGVAARFNQPHDIVFDSTASVFYIADFINSRIRKMTLGAVVTTLAGDGRYAYKDGALLAAQFKRPIGLALDGKGNLYVADVEDHRIRKIDLKAGMVSTVAGDGRYNFRDGAAGSASFRGPRGLAWFEDALYIADRYNHRIRKLDLKTMWVTTFAGGSLGFANGPATTAKFNEPTRLFWGPVGDLYVTDGRNKSIRRILTR